MTGRLAVVVVAVGVGRLPAAAEPYVAAPIVGWSDTRSQGPIARDWLELAGDQAWISAPGSEPWTRLTRLRLGLGPLSTTPGQGRALVGALDHWAVRAEATVVAGPDHTAGGPLTIAVQRYLRIEPLAIVPLLHVHTGIETAVSTPWLADRGAPPPRALQIASGVDTELAQNGWSVRPFSPYLRGDFSVCRSIHLELGLAPEMFVPPRGATEVDLRFHGEAGFSLACSRTGVERHIALGAAYAGRARLHAADQPVAYHDQLSFGVQLDVATDYLDGVVAGFVAWDPGHRAYTMVGVRLQLGLAAWFRRSR